SVPANLSLHDALPIFLSGSSPLAGYATLDADPAYDPDYLAHIPPLPSPVMRMVWDEIALIHGIEHIHPGETDRLLRETHAILVRSEEHTSELQSRSDL